ncbi:hypothetical protein PVK06_034561 [Gossypium arboreum]|uniref:Uncharacterized protein n=1 Tax=Gossypium arboreum TaxID=29729 RepID=A0ABR0NEH0_GOSAR|nr:hypothetical protein PVK06_034561 [Gossypium arboreum]
MFALYCPLGRLNTEPIQLFTELEDIKPVENVTQLSQQYEVEDPRTKMDLNNDCSDHEGENFSDPNLDDVTNDIDYKGPDGGNDHIPLVENLSHGIIICNDSEVYMSIVDPNTADASKFPEGLDIIVGHLMLKDPESKDLFMGQRFTSKDECVDAIKRSSLKGHRGLDFKTICNYILAMVKDDSTIAVLVLITEMQEWFHYRVSYWKAWLAK